MALNHIRPSNFIYTHGPGSILETNTGPVMVMGMNALFEQIQGRDVSIRGRTVTLGKPFFEIHDRRLSSVLNDVRFVRLPSNQEIGLADRETVYPTYGGFPSWSLCEGWPSLLQAFDVIIGSKCYCQSLFVHL